MIMEERIQKILSQRGVCSRRKAEEYITQGLVKVNGKVAELGQKADPESDIIEVEGAVLSDRQEMLYYVMNKPVGVVTENVSRLRVNSLTRSNKVNPHLGKRVNELTSNSTSVRDLLPPSLQGKIYPVGRLDKDSCGLLLLTNDGVLAYRLTHPKFDHEKEYEVTVERTIPQGALAKLEKGMTISGTKTKPATVKKLAPNRFTIILTEGRNRQIRRMCQKVGNPVKNLRRIRIMTLTDSKLKPGEMRELSKQEVQTLLENVGVL
jgi:pseudouridine synthase